MEDAPHNLVADVMLGGVVLLGAALIAVLIFRRLGLGAVLGYLVAGIAIGPDGLGLIGAPETILAYSEIGIILLLFLVGLELSPSRLWLLRRDILLFGPLQVTLCGLGMFAIIQFAMPPFSWEAALVLGLPLALSSTAQVLPLLQSRGRMKTDYGEKSFSILLFQDISIVPLLTIVAALSRAPADDGAITGWRLVLYAVLAILGLVLAGRYLLSPLLRLVGKISERELFIVTGLFTVCVSAAVMQAIGVSPALGAFVAGVMLAESPYRHELEADIDPFRSILLGLFFLAVGMLLDVDVILAQPLFVAGLALALVAVKIAIIFALGRFFGLKSKPSIIMAMLLSQGGEFAFVLFTAAQQALLIEPEAASLFGAVVTLSMASTPFLMIIAGKLAAQKPKGAAQLDDPALASRANVIIVGHGRFGQQVSQIMQAAGRSVTLIDINPRTIDISGEFGVKVFYGDGTRIDLALMEDNGISIIRELFESSIRMSVDALKFFGTDREAIHEIIAEFRRRDRNRLKAQFSSGDLHAGKRHSFGGDDSDDFLIAQD
jgi:monovalent cation:proton antiporter-2 (CPA2) family protein